MILELLFNLIANCLNAIPFNLPSLPDRFMTILDNLLDLILQGFSYLNLFIDVKLWIECAIAMTIIYNIKHIYNLVIYLLNWIPGFEIAYWE